MFNRRERFSNRLLFDDAAFNDIVRLLKEAGFSEINVRVPEDYKNFPKKVFTPEEFLTTNYNFTAQILSAAKKDESIKIMFINNSNAKGEFEDKIFPSSHSSSSKYYVESVDPVRLSGLQDFVRTLLAEKSLRHSYTAKLQTFFAVVSGIFLFSTPYLLTGNFRGTDFGILTHGPAALKLVLLLLLITSPVYLFFHMIYPGGLYVAPFEHRIISFARRIYLGDLKNNLLLSFFWSVAKILLIGLVANIFYNVIWAFYGQGIMKTIASFLG